MVSLISKVLQYRFHCLGLELGQDDPQGWKNSLHQTAFLNAPEFERIFPTSVGNFAVRNLYST